MRKKTAVAAMICVLSALPALAQTDTGARPGNVIGTGQSLPRSNKASNIDRADTRSSIAPNLPTPPLGENATPRDYIIAARNALAAGRTGEAQQAMEMAETRLLDRSTPAFHTDSPSRSPITAAITEARHALAGGDRAGAVQILDRTLTNLPPG